MLVAESVVEVDTDLLVYQTHDQLRSTDGQEPLAPVYAVEKSDMVVGHAQFLQIQCVSYGHNKMDS